MSDLEHYDAPAVEKKWDAYWSTEKTYAYHSTQERSQTYVIDPPPPTVSGALHIGHVFSYTHTDILARFQRMQGKNVFYPVGYDDNGLPTERRIQNLYGVVCHAHLPYDPHWKPVVVQGEGHKKEPISRKNFLELCTYQTQEDEKKYEALWRHLGLSVDWSQQYVTIGEHACRIAQLSFLDLVKKAYAYSMDMPTLWDSGFQTAVAQAEVEDRPRKAHFYDLQFGLESGGSFFISTTRPELLAGCIAVVAHPQDERYKHFFGKKAITPLFRVAVPILPSEHADPAKGTGILMVCTFGDAHDVAFWKKTELPLRQIIGRDGRLLDLYFGQGPFFSLDVEGANYFYAFLKGLSVSQARTKILELLRMETSAAVKGFGPALTKEPQPTEQMVKYYEKGEIPLEFIPSRQWFVRLLEHKSEFLEQGKKIHWHPAFMEKKYEQWVEGLNQDWCISRQRYFGVPFPVWYPLDEKGVVLFDQPLFADDALLPLDPLLSAPPGFLESQRGQPSGFVGDADVMDTWATSALTPQINSHWKMNQKRHDSLFPADLRPQGHDIIRTWAFYTIAKAWFHEGLIPWKSIALSGWIVDPHRKKMSKSKGNTVTPELLLQQYSADSIRYWAGRSKLGQDTIYDEKMFQAGKRLTTKLLNIARFIVKLCIEEKKNALPDIISLLDQAWIQKMKGLIESSSAFFHQLDYAQALMDTEQLFWDFCDNYVELVKTRVYQKKDQREGVSASFTLEWTLKVFVRLFAPFFPYITEEIWSVMFKGEGKKASIHTSFWPHPDEISGEVPLKVPMDKTIYDCACRVLNQMRAAKSSEKKSLKWPIEKLQIKVPPTQKDILKALMPDLCAAGSVRHFFLEDSQNALEVHIELAKENPLG